MKSYPDEPEISFLSGEVIKGQKDALGNDIYIYRVNIEFVDGDGGFEKNDNKPPFDKSSVYYHNLLIDYFIKKDGKFQEEKGDKKKRFYARIHHVKGKHNTQIGTVIHDIVIPVTDFPLPAQIKFRIQLLDKNHNRSNIVESPIISIGQ
ncbi:hypothetical protein JBKA6_0208 [Ichthyobacterium seriolicida]|uniref:Uncharacterized protein n=1 Tax=Ichthyobacterium seriolicida TaxID=242600 RepID=A0A1J1DZW6_9FLAO|nr:hypothetical protein JBKA6_0208 [Ichthyobacterium seriolicida]